MKLYLSSYLIPTPGDLAKLLGQPLAGTKVAVIPNGKDYYSTRARNFKIGERRAYMESLGFDVTITDLLEYDDAATLEQALAGHDLIWVTGGNTFCLRYEMRRSGFEDVLPKLLKRGIVYGGDSAGAIIMGPSIAGIEDADIPQFAEVVINEGLGLIPQVVLPHVDNPEFASTVPTVHELHRGKHPIIELKDSQAVVINDREYNIVESITDR